MLFKIICRFAKLYETLLFPQNFCQGGVRKSVITANCQPFPRKKKWVEKEKVHNLITSPFMMRLYADLQNYVKLFTLSRIFVKVGWGNPLWLSQQCQPFPRKEHMGREKAHDLIKSSYMMKLYADLHNWVELFSPPAPRIFVKVGGKICYHTCIKMSTFPKKRMHGGGKSSQFDCISVHDEIICRSAKFCATLLSVKVGWGGEICSKCPPFQRKQHPG